MAGKRVAVLFCALVCSTSAFADAVLQFEARTGQEAPISRTLIVKGGRVGFVNGSKSTVHTIFDQSQSAFAFINHSDRQFTIITSEFMRQMQQAAQESMKKMQARVDKQVQNMSPQQRAMYEQGRMMMPMMTPYMANLTSPNYLRTAVPLFIKQNIKGFECNRIDLLEGGRKTQELCVAQQDQVKDLAANDYQTLLSMLKVTQELDALGAFSLGFQRPFLSGWGGGNPGLPISVTEVSGTATTTTTLVTMQKENVDPQRLQLPPGYLQAKIPLPIR